MPEFLPNASPQIKSKLSFHFNWLHFNCLELIKLLPNITAKLTEEQKMYLGILIDNQGDAFEDLGKPFNLLNHTTTKMGD